MGKRVRILSHPWYPQVQGLKPPRAWIGKQCSPSPQPPPLQTHNPHHYTNNQHKILRWETPPKPRDKESGFDSHSIWLWAFRKTMQKEKHHELHGLFIFSLVQALLGSKFIFLVSQIKKNLGTEDMGVLHRLTELSWIWTCAPVSWAFLSSWATLHTGFSLQLSNTAHPRTWTEARHIVAREGFGNSRIRTYGSLGH